MLFDVTKFEFVKFCVGENKINNHYLNQCGDIITQKQHVKDLGIIMSSNCTFEKHISTLVQRCKQLSGWILRTFTNRSPNVMLTLWKSLVLSRADYGSQLWSPEKCSEISKIESLQRKFTKHVLGCHSMTYAERLKHLK